MSGRKYIIIGIGLFLFLAFSFESGAALAGSKKGTYDTKLEQLKRQQKDFLSQKEQLNKKILSLEKTQAQLERAAEGKKYSSKEFEAEVKKREDLEKQITSSVVSLADVEDKLNHVEIQIKECQKRKDAIESVLSMEAMLAKEAKEEKAKSAKAARLVKGKETEEAIEAAGVENQPLPEREQGVDSAKIEYKIAAHDELQINVYGEPDLTKTVRVAVDGTISYPLLGRVKVAGLTTQELEDKLGKLLSAGGFIVNPQVSVYMERFSTVSILGEVRNPGSYELKGKAGILDAIAQSGGFNIDADINNVKILRMEDGEQKTIELRLGDIKKGIEGAEIALKPNDTIFVEKIGKVTVLGEVVRPGTFELKEKTTVLEAIAMAGGFTDIAAVNRTRVIRREDGAKKMIRINITDITYRGNRKKDIELLPGDIVYVPESLF